MRKTHDQISQGPIHHKETNNEGEIKRIATRVDETNNLVENLEIHKVPSKAVSHIYLHLFQGEKRLFSLGLNENADITHKMRLPLTTPTT